MPEDPAVEEVRKALDQPYPKSWRFDEHGDEIIGYAVRLENAQSKYGPTPVLILQLPGSGELRSVWLSHTALFSKLQRSRPKAGDLIGIRRLGERKSASGTDYMDYNVAVYGQKGGQLDWGEAPRALEGQRTLDGGEVVQGEVVPTASEGPDWSDSGGWG